VAHACNPSHSNSSRNPISKTLKKKKKKKKGLVKWLKVKALSSSPSSTKKQNKTKQNAAQLTLREGK
jgi:hypothetical protein